ncbi:MAG: pseudouridine synthase [Clostridiales bacterium]|nr:pseudouridine synthase [Clostridiales bacterium]
MKGIRLDKYLADMKKGTRSQIKTDIRKGIVSVNGVVENSPQRKITSEDQVCYGKETVSYDPHRYFLMNKPAGVITATKDAKERTVLSLLKPEDRTSDLFPVGRLDKDTEGLLLLTNDGELAHTLLSPKKHVEKAYYVRLDGVLTKEGIGELERGILLKDGTRCKPAQCEVLATDLSLKTCEVVLTITEGKYHQVKRMMAALKTHVSYLKRIRMGTLVLDDSLTAGTYRELTKEEQNKLMESIKH